MAAAIKFIKPRRIKIKQIDKRLINGLLKETNLIISLFRKTTQTWEGVKPVFKPNLRIAKDGTSIIRPSGEIEGIKKWSILELGSPAHSYSARRVPKLKFRHGSGFKAKTKVRVLGSGIGANTGVSVRVKRVNHPGSKAREWSKEAIRRRKNKFTQQMSKAARIWP